MQDRVLRGGGDLLFCGFMFHGKVGHNMRKIQRLSVLMCCTLLAGACFSAPALAGKEDKKPKQTVSVVEKVTPADLAKVENYLQNLKTAQARFVQTTHNGQQLVGTFSLKRPGKLRFEYDPPVKNFVVADGMFIYFYDGELEEQTNAPIGTTLADFFLRKNFSLSEGLTVKEAKRAGGLLQVQVVQSDDPEGGSLSFAFTENPLELKRWRVIDAQGLITEVELFYIKRDVEFDSKLFVYVDPNKKSGKRTYNE